MIKKNEEMKKTVKPQMRGGEGSAIVTEILDNGEYQGHARLLATITLEPGCSIGEHVHEDEEEVFYIIDGTALYNDNGRDVLLEKGDSCLCLSGQKHSIANNDEKETLIFTAVILTL
jgi:quercetin dioxygenase-like cupin family protein